MKRVIYVEPIIENNNLIYEFFYKYNSDSKFVNPHICLVFPFESNIETSTIDELFRNVFDDINSFKISLSGIEESLEEKNNFLFLKVNDASDNLKNLIQKLYKRLEGSAKLKGEYNPHITIAKNSSVDCINSIMEEAKCFSNISFDAYVDNINCGVLSKDENGNIVLKNELVYSLDNVKNK